MRLFFAVLAVQLAAFAVSAHSAHDSLLLSSRHARLSRNSGVLTSKAVPKRCPARKNKNKNKSTQSTSSSKKKVSPTSSAVSPPKVTKPSSDKPSSEVSDSSPSTPIKGLINVKSSCGDIRASKKTTEVSGPNGHIDWLNCGVNDGGWRPPYVTLDDIVSTSLSDAIKQDGSPFKACSKFVGLFNKYGEKYNLPAIMIASFAMQESSCNPGTVGGGGEQGLMQLTSEKCGGAPGGNCRDPDFNIRTGAKYFRGLLDSNNNNLLLCIGSYNGWQKGMTHGSATAMAKSSCCRCQNNLDYLHQFLNGWLQNKNVYGGTPRIGKYFNLDVC